MLTRRSRPISGCVTCERSGTVIGGTVGKVTFLFTDVEGSTRLWAADKDAMSASLSVHDAILRGAIEGPPQGDRGERGLRVHYGG